VTTPTDALLTSKDVLNAFIERSWRSNAARQRDKGIEFVIGRRDGMYLWNLEGDKRVLDCGTGGGVHSLGHRHPEVLAALKGALDEGRDTGLWSMPNAEYLRLQDKLARLTPHPHLNRSVVTLASTTSVDVAAMFAFRFTNRQKILAYRYGYHGHSGFAALVTGSAEEGILQHYNLPTEYSDFFDDYGNLTEIKKHLTFDVAAVILELMNYETFAPASHEFVEGLAELCNKNGILLIIDETRTGLGRTGRFWASEHYDFTPDMLITGKGLSGGLYPVSALQLRQEIYDRCMNEHRFAYISSLGGNEISCIVGTKVLEVASQPQFIENTRLMSKRMSDGLASVCAKHHNLLSQGSSFGCIFTVRINHPAVAPELYRTMFQEGILCHSVSEIEPSVLKFFPPLMLEAQHVDEIVGALDRVAGIVK
jgi:putrescine aminotransferase